MARPQLPDEAALKPHNFLILTISAAVLGHKHPLRRGINGVWALPLPARQSLQEMELKVLTPFGLPEHLRVSFNEGDLLLVLFHT